MDELIEAQRRQVPKFEVLLAPGSTVPRVPLPLDPTVLCPLPIEDSTAIFTLIFG